MEHFSSLLSRAKSSTCTLATCPISSSYYYYRVSLAANAVFVALFGLSLLAFVITYGFTRRALVFNFAFFCGTLLEVIGYAGRLISWQNQWSENGFLMQIICLTIAPAFMAGGIYLCLRKIVYVFGAENSRISPEAYTRIFIPCDVLSLVLQAAGGGLASAASHSGKSPETGDHIMVAGLSFQVFTLAVFIGLCLDFAIRTRRRHHSLGSSGALDQNPAFVALRSDWKFKGFLYALSLATICILWRSIYRVIELAQGWSGDLIRRQNLFIGFEGVMVLIACLVLNAFNPAFCFKEGDAGAAGFGDLWRARKARNGKEVAAAKVNAGYNSSDVDVEVSPIPNEKPIETNAV